MTLPQWSTPERREHLVALFQKYGNQCLLGHDVCPEIEHYLMADTELVPRYHQSFPKGDESRTNSYVQSWSRQKVRLPAVVPARLYNKLAEAAIESWKDEDRERRTYEWKLEQQQIVDGTYGKYGSTFDPVSRDVFVNNRPEYYLVGLGVNPFTYQRVALVRIPSTMVHLFVDVGGAVQEVSKNARRKARRYGKDGAIKATIDQRCRAAVAHWWSGHR